MSNAHPTSPVPEGTNSNLPSSRTTARTVSKLRDSCHACAVSKVKCHKQKPICSRCAKRGISCDYFITKRPGRKRNNSYHVDHELIDKTNEQPPASPDEQAIWDGVVHSSKDDLGDVSRRSSDMFEPDLPGNFDASVTEYSSSMISTASDTIFDLSMSLDSSSLSFLLAGMNNEFDHFSTSSMEFSELEGMDTNDPAQKQPDIAKLLIPDDTLHDSPSNKVSFGHSSLSDMTPSWKSLTSVDEIMNLSNSSQATCLCLTEALGILKNISSPKLSNDIQVTIWSTMESTTDTLAQSIVIENKQAIESVSTMLQCSCTKDGYLLTILSMILFKILWRYTEAVRKRSAEAIESHWNHSRSHNQLGRYSAQSILGELHGVRRLINLLSPRLKGSESGTSLVGLGRGEPHKDSKSSSFVQNGAAADPFSTIILDQIGTNLHKALSASSLEIISLLRQS